LQSTVIRWAPPFLGMICCAILYQIVTTRPLPDPSAFLASTDFAAFQAVFISIVLEALPFILLGVAVSSILQIFVTEDMVRRYTPRNPAAGILFACVLGLLFPVCECGMIPVIRRLMHKGMPAYMAVVFILAGPVLNPITFASTYIAFHDQPEVAYARMGLAFAAAAAVGFLLYRFMRKDPLRHSLAAGDTRHSHRQGGLLTGILGHSSEEFFEMGKYLILGAGITAFIQTSIGDSLYSMGQGGLSSHLFMAGLAYVLSLCSTSDAFVAASFSTQFSKSSLLTFLVLGPMIDFKGTLMLLSVFKSRFVLRLSLLTALVVVAGAILTGQLSSLF
jgi:uncharacterized protein